MDVKEEKKSFGRVCVCKMCVTEAFVNILRFAIETRIRSSNVGSSGFSCEKLLFMLLQKRNHFPPFHLTIHIESFSNPLRASR